MATEFRVPIHDSAPRFLSLHRIESTMKRSLLIVALIVATASAAEPASKYAEIRVVDSVTNRGVPLVELETVNGMKFVTDNAGRIAFQEPGLMDRELFFNVRSHGYEFPKDGFGIAGVRVTPRIEKSVEIKVVRKNAAERLCRLTGEGLYRDTVLLGHKPPLAESPGKIRSKRRSTRARSIGSGAIHFEWNIRWACSEWPGRTRRSPIRNSILPVASLTTISPRRNPGSPAR